MCSRPTSIMLLRKVLLLCVKIVYGFLLMLVAYRGSAEPLLLSPGMMYTCSSNGLEAVMGRLLGASSNVGARDGALGACAAAPFPLELCFVSAALDGFPLVPSPKPHQVLQQVYFSP